MSVSDRSSEATAPGGWLANQPYLLLSITALCWAGNAIVGRLAAGHIPPVTLSFLRWSIAFLIILPFAWKHLKRDWGAIRARLGQRMTRGPRRPAVRGGESVHTPCGVIRGGEQDRRISRRRRDGRLGLDARLLRHVYLRQRDRSCDEQRGEDHSFGKSKPALHLQG